MSVLGHGTDSHSDAQQGREGYWYRSASRLRDRDRDRVRARDRDRDSMETPELHVSTGHRVRVRVRVRVRAVLRFFLRTRRVRFRYCFDSK